MLEEAREFRVDGTNRESGCDAARFPFGRRARRDAGLVSGVNRTLDQVSRSIIVKEQEKKKKERKKERKKTEGTRHERSFEFRISTNFTNRSLSIFVSFGTV